MAQSSAPGTYFLRSGVLHVIQNSQNAYKRAPHRPPLFPQPDSHVPVVDTQQSDVLFFYNNIPNPTHTLADSGGDLEVPQMASDPEKRLAVLADLESKLRFAGVAMEHATHTEANPTPDQTIAKTGIVMVTNPMVGVPVPGALYAMSVPRELDEEVDDRVRPVLRRCTDHFSDVAETFANIQAHAMYSRDIRLEGLDVRRGFCKTQIEALETMNSGLIKMVLTGVHALIRQGFLMPWNPKWSTVVVDDAGNQADPAVLANNFDHTLVGRSIPSEIGTNPGGDSGQQLRQTIRHFAQVQMQHRAFPVQAEGYVFPVPEPGQPERALIEQIARLQKYLLKPTETDTPDGQRQRKVQNALRHGLASYIAAGRVSANVQPAIGFVSRNEGQADNGPITAQSFRVEAKVALSEPFPHDGGLYDFVEMQKNGFSEFTGAMEQFYQSKRDRIVGVLNSSIDGKHSFTLGAS